MTQNNLKTNFDFAQLQCDIVAASKQAFTEIACELDGIEHIGGFCLATDEGAMTVVPAFAPRSYLEELDYSFDAFIWEEWPLEHGADDAFDAICAWVGDHVLKEVEEKDFAAFQKALLHAMTEALKEVRREVVGVANPFIWMLGVSDSELLDTDLPKLVRELNSADIAAKFDEHWAG